MNYSLTAVAGIALAIAYDLWIARTRLVTRRAFWTAYAIVLGFQLVVNGVLTGMRIVRYDDRRIIGWRVAYAPVEDLAFGYAMVLVTLATWVWLGRTHRAAPDGPNEAPTTRPLPGAERRR